MVGNIKAMPLVERYCPARLGEEYVYDAVDVFLTRRILLPKGVDLTTRQSPKLCSSPPWASAFLNIILEAVFPLVCLPAQRFSSPNIIC